MVENAVRKWDLRMYYQLVPEHSDFGIHDS